MKTSHVVWSRLVAWVCALGALVALVVAYDQLPDLLPVTRWSLAPRTPFVALRVPVLNLLTLLLVEVLVRALSRTSATTVAYNVGCTLFLTVGSKAALEAAELLLLPSRSPFLLLTLGATVVVGLGSALFLARSFLAGCLFQHPAEPIPASHFHGARNGRPWCHRRCRPGATDRWPAVVARR